MEKISIVIPAYNEEKRIEATLEKYGSFFNSLKLKTGLDYEILIVINNTTDKTEEIVKKEQKKNKNIRYLNLGGWGKGYAIIEGFKDALKRENDLIGFVDADMATSPEAFYDLIKNIGRYDGIIASRYIRGSVVKPKQTMQRIIASRIFNLIIKTLFLFPYGDTQCGAKILRKSAAKAIVNRLGMTKWAFDIDLLYQLKKGGFKIREFPTVWSDKEYSKLNLKKAGFFMLLSIIRLRILNSIFKRFVKIYDHFVGKLIKI